MRPNIVQNTLRLTQQIFSQISQMYTDFFSVRVCAICETSKIYFKYLARETRNDLIIKNLPAESFYILSISS